MTRAVSTSSVTESPAAAQRAAPNKFSFRLFPGTTPREEEPHSCTVSFAVQAAAFREPCTATTEVSSHTSEGEEAFLPQRGTALLSRGRGRFHMQWPHHPTIRVPWDHCTDRTGQGQAAGQLSSGSTVYVAAVAANDSLADSVLVSSSKGHPLMDSSQGMPQKMRCFCGLAEASPPPSRGLRDTATTCLGLAHKPSSLPTAIRVEASTGVMGRSMSFSPRSSSSSSSCSSSSSSSPGSSGSSGGGGGGGCGGCSGMCILRTGEDSPGSDSQMFTTVVEGVPMCPAEDASADPCTCHVSTVFATGGAAGEDRVQAVCSDGGWLFCGIYDGFNGRDAADFLGANFFLNVSKELELSKHTGHLVSVDGVKRSINCTAQTQLPDAVCDGLQRALEATEEQFFSTVQANLADRADLSMSGSCVVSVLILNGILYVMNLGDSQAVLATGDKWQSPTGCSRNPTAEATVDAALQPNGAPQESCHLRTEELDEHETSFTAARSLGLRKPNQGTLERLGFGAKWQVLANQHWHRQPHNRVFLEMGSCGYPQEGRKALSSQLPMPEVKQRGFKHLADHPRENLETHPQEHLAAHRQENLATHPRAVLLTESHNVENEAEWERVMREHPEDPRAIEKDRVKGKLRVTRAFGAGYLKHEAMNNALPGIFRVKDLKSDPYISSTPHMYSHELSPEDQFIVLGSDGVFDFFTKEEVVELVAHHMTQFPHSDPSTFLLDQVLHRAAMMSGVTRDEMRDAPAVKRRKYHDDATVIVIPLNCV